MGNQIISGLVTDAQQYNDMAWSLSPCAAVRKFCYVQVSKGACNEALQGIQALES